MKVNIKHKVANKKIVVGDIVQVDFRVSSDIFVAVEHENLNNGRLTLVSLSGDALQGSRRGANVSLEEHLTRSCNSTGWEIFSKDRYELTVTKAGA
jgi:hypothetical protein